MTILTTNDVLDSDAHIDGIVVVSLKEASEETVLATLAELSHRENITGICLRDIDEPLSPRVMKALFNLSQDLPQLSVLSLRDTGYQEIPVIPTINSVLNERVNDDHFGNANYFLKDGALATAWVESNQSKYAILCQTSVNKSREMMHGQNSLRDVYTMLAKQRADIAEFFNSEDKQYFGLVRTTSDIPKAREPAWTMMYDDIDPGNPKNNRYRDFRELLKERFTAQPMSSEEVDNGHMRFKPSKNADVLCVFKDGLPLSEIAITKNGKGQEKMEIKHSSSDHTDAVFAHLEPLFERVVAAKDLTETLQDIAEIAWYLSHAMPTLRGNAAIVEMLVQGMMDNAGFPPCKYNATLTLDLQAIFEPDLDKFKQEFVNFYPALIENYAPDRSQNTRISS